MKFHREENSKRHNQQRQKDITLSNQVIRRIVHTNFSGGAGRKDYINSVYNILYTLESSRSAFSRSSGLLRSRTSCSADCIFRSLLPWEPAAAELAEDEPEPPKAATAAAFIDRDCGKLAIKFSFSPNKKLQKNKEKKKRNLNNQKLLKEFSGGTRVSIQKKKKEFSYTCRTCGRPLPFRWCFPQRQTMQRASKERAIRLRSLYSISASVGGNEICLLF